MIEYSSKIVEETGTVVLKSAPELIAALRLPKGAGVIEGFHRTIDDQSEQVAAAFRRGLYTDLAEAGVAEAAAEARLHEGRERYAAAEAEFERHAAEQEGSWAKAAICIISVCACFAAEFVLTWHALTFMLNVDKRSLLGILLGLAPPCALAVLEFALSRLLEEPWRRVHAAPQPGGWRAHAVQALMVLFLVALAWGNIRTVLFLAQAREEAARTQYALLHDGAAVEPDREVIRLAVVAVSVCVTVDGALFLLMAMTESRAILRRRLAGRKAARLRTQAETLESEARKAHVAAEISRKGWQDADETAGLAAARFRGQCLLELEEALERARLECTDEWLVRAALASAPCTGVL